MKKAILSIALLLAITTYLNAQVFVTGSLSTFFSKNEIESDGFSPTGEVSTFHSAVYLKGGHFFNDNFAVGLSAGFSFNKEKIEETYYNSTQINRSFSSSLFAQYFFLHKNSFSLGVEGGVSLKCTNGFNNSLSDSSINRNKYVDSYNLDFYIKPVLFYWINDHWSLTSSFGSLNYSHAWSGKTLKGNAIAFDTSLSSISFGVLYRF